MTQAWNFKIKNDAPKYKWKKFVNNFYTEFIEICKMSQDEVKNMLMDKLVDYEYVPFSFDGGIVAVGELPILLTAHMDTVHKERVKEVKYRMENDDVIINSPQGIGGDDRCGIYIILKLLKDGFRPSIIFCEDEEIGCVGSRKATENKAVMNMLQGNRYIVELDRRGSNDAVYYDCANPDFEEYITEQTERKTAWGSCSDISYLAPELGIAAVNFSVGYYNEHHLDEEINLAQLEETVYMMRELLTHEAECEPYEGFKYMEKSWFGGFNNTKPSSYFLDWDDEFDDGIISIYEFVFVENEEESIDSFEANDYYQALGFLFEAHPTIRFNDVFDWYRCS